MTNDLPSPQTTPPPLAATRAPVSPVLTKASSVEDLLPFLDAVAQRKPPVRALHAAWDLTPGEKVLMMVDNWTDELVVEAAVKTLEKYGCDYELRRRDLGDMQPVDGASEIELFTIYESSNDPTAFTHDSHFRWLEVDERKTYDKIIAGPGGSLLDFKHLKWRRFPFFTPEMVMSMANTLPYELLDAIDRWTWDRARFSRYVHITDPEGTDLHYRNPDELWDKNREFYDYDVMMRWFPHHYRTERTYAGSHIALRPGFYMPEHLEEGYGVMAGTMNHIGPYPHMSMKMEKSRIVEITGGGPFGDRLREIADRTSDIQYPGQPGKGLLSWVEAAIGTNPHSARPKIGYPNGWISNLNERGHSGVLHVGYGSAMYTEPEREAARMGLPTGHWHIHMYFPTVEVELADGSKEFIIKDGRLQALDAPEIRELASRYGDPDVLLKESWIPAVPGINVEGDYARDYARDPMKWIMAELDLSANWHDLYEKLVKVSPISSTSC